MPTADNFMRSTVPHTLRQMKTDTVKYLPDGAADIPANWKSIDGIVSPAEDQNLNEGNPALQFGGLILDISNRSNTEGNIVTVCHGEAGNITGGDRVQLSRDNYVTTWNVKRLLSTAAGMNTLFIVDNPGAIT